MNLASRWLHSLFFVLPFQSKLSKRDRKLKKNVMFNLQHASRSLIDKNYGNAIKLYKTALNKIEKTKVCLFVSPLPLLNVV